MTTWRKAGNVGEDRAERLYQSAKSAHRAGQHATAGRLAKQALACAEDPELRARLELTLAYVEAETGNASAGLNRCKAILARSGLPPGAHGLAWSQLGLLTLREGRSSEALRHFDRAIPLLGGEELGRALLNRGNLHLHRGEPRAAEADLTRAVDELSLAGEQEAAGKATHNLGYARLLSGELLEALDAMERASTMLAPMSPVTEAVCAQDRAEVLLAAGRTHDAATALGRATAAYSAAGLRRYQAECELVLARTLLLEDPANGRLVAWRSARRFARQGSGGWALRAQALAVIGDMQRGLRRKGLLDQADELAAQLRREGHAHDAQGLALHAARLAVRRGQLTDAGRRIRSVRLGAESPITLRLLKSEVCTELAHARRRRSTALGHARRGLEELHAWQSCFGSLDLHSTLVGHGRQLARSGLGLALEDGSPAVVLEWAERARALASRVTAVRPPHDPEQARALAELRTLGHADPERAAVLRERIRARSWRTAHGGVGQPVTMDALRAELDRGDAALVAHVVLDDRVTALVVTGAGAGVVQLGSMGPLRGRLDRLRADLDMAASHPRGSLGEAIRSSLAAQLSALDEQLVVPLAHLLEDRRVVLTPSGSLAGIPWPLLPGVTGRPLTVPPSASRWVELRQRPAAKLKRVGLVAGPNVERANEEAARAAAAWPQAELLTGGSVTCPKISALASRVDLLHLAGHGRHSWDNPLFSSFELLDGPWFGHDLELLPKTPEVVVLSACELGRVSVRHREETVGMTAAWLHVGAGTVLSSPALIADDVACEAMAHWHSSVAGGTPPADALADVQASIRGTLPLISFGAGW